MSASGRIFTRAQPATNANSKHMLFRLIELKHPVTNRTYTDIFSCSYKQLYKIFRRPKQYLTIGHCTHLSGLTNIKLQIIIYLVYGYDLTSPQDKDLCKQDLLDTVAQLDQLRISYKGINLVSVPPEQDDIKLPPINTSPPQQL